MLRVRVCTNLNTVSEPAKDKRYVDSIQSGAGVVSSIPKWYYLTMWNSLVTSLLLMRGRSCPADTLINLYQRCTGPLFGTEDLQVGRLCHNVRLALYQIRWRLSLAVILIRRLFAINGSSRHAGYLCFLGVALQYFSSDIVIKAVLCTDSG